MTTLTTINNPHMFQLEGWLFDYPMRESSPKGWPFLGYSSEMVNLSLGNDDPEAFIYFMRLAGCDKNSLTFDNKTMESYCDKRKAKKCKAALDRI